MNRPRDEFLPSAGLPSNQDCRIAAGDFGDQRQYGLQRPRGANDLLEHRRLVDFFSQCHVFLLKPLFRPLAIVDISTGDIPPEDLALVVAHRVVTSQKPTITSITST